MPLTPNQKASIRNAVADLAGHPLNDDEVEMVDAAASLADRLATTPRADADPAQLTLAIRAPFRICPECAGTRKRPYGACRTCTEAT